MVAEALACQKAVVASAVGGIPEIIENGRSGVLVEPDHPAALARELLALLEDGSLRKSLGHAGYRESIFGAGAWKSSSVTLLIPVEPAQRVQDLLRHTSLRSFWTLGLRK